MVQRTEPTTETEPLVSPNLVGSDRVLAVLAELARHPDGIGLDDLARSMLSPKPTVHRALAALRRAGFAAKNGRGHYVLGDELLRLAFTNYEARPDHLRVLPILEQLSQRYGETTHYAVLDGRDVVYRAKVDPPLGAIKLTSAIGGRNPAHATAVGKLLLSFELGDEGAVRDWVKSGPALERRTDHTITGSAALAAELARVRKCGYATEEQENEIGIACLAVPMFLTSKHKPIGAVSISALVYRTQLSTLVDDVAEIQRTLDPGAHELAS